MSIAKANASTHEGRSISRGVFNICFNNYFTLIASVMR